MFEPEYADITCPDCHRREVYFDLEAGHYCMFCGRGLNAEEVFTLIELEVSTTVTENCLKSPEKQGSCDRPGSLAAIADRLRALLEVALLSDKEGMQES